MPGTATYEPPGLEGLRVDFPGANAHRVQQFRHENLAVADLARPGYVGDGLDHLVDPVIVNREFELYLWKEINDVLGSSIQFSVTFLPSEALDLGHSDALNTDLRQGLADVVELERLDDRGHHFHESPQYVTGGSLTVIVNAPDWEAGRDLQSMLFNGLDVNCAPAGAFWTDCAVLPAPVPHTHSLAWRNHDRPEDAR